MIFGHNPKKSLIRELKKSEELYEKLYKISKGDRGLTTRASRASKNLSLFLEKINNLNAQQIKDLLDDA